MKTLFTLLMVGAALALFSANRTEAYKMVNVDPAQRAVDFTEKVIKSMYPDVVTDTDNANFRIWIGFDGKDGSGSVIFEVTMKFSLNNGQGRDGAIVQRACVFDIMELPILSYGRAITWKGPQ
jgi:hypothetical protein